MVSRFALTQLAAALVIAGVTLSACGGTESVSKTAPPAVKGDSAEERELRRTTAAMQKTIWQGAAAGAGAGALLDLAIGGDDDVGFGTVVGLGAGAAAGTYVAHVQSNFARRSQRLKEVQKDLDRNAEEMTATINAMNAVLRVQKQELAAIKLQTEQGTADPKALAQETAEANGNLSQMNLAIDGATKRQQDFIQARDLTKRTRQDASPIDPDLAILASRIEEMKAIANDLATTL